MLVIKYGYFLKRLTHYFHEILEMFDGHRSRILNASKIDHEIKGFCFLFGLM
uniref:Uncharacterized protein n=1 Tax=Heterorhabditis bacteriophora TaxID=37862 RepID=A0A1I7WU86_HETBA